MMFSGRLTKWWRLTRKPPDNKYAPWGGRGMVGAPFATPTTSTHVQNIGSGGSTTIPLQPIPLQPISSNHAGGNTAPIITQQPPANTSTSAIVQAYTMDQLQQQLQQAVQERSLAETEVIGVGRVLGRTRCTGCNLRIENVHTVSCIHAHIQLSEMRQRLASMTAQLQAKEQELSSMTERAASVQVVSVQCIKSYVYTLLRCLHCCDVTLDHHTTTDTITPKTGCPCITTAASPKCTSSYHPAPQPPIPPHPPRCTTSKPTRCCCACRRCTGKAGLGCCMAYNTWQCCYGG